MALPDLATTADLTARGATFDAGVATTMLAVASASVRGAAGSPILSTASTISVPAWGDQILDLPGLPVTAVTTVTVAGEVVTDYTVLDGRLWCARGWGYRLQPTNVTVTYTHGFAEVPEDVVQLVCDLAIAGVNAAPDGATDPRVVAERIDDYSVTFTQGAEAVASVMEIPPRTRRWLASRFGGGAGMVTHR